MLGKLELDTLFQEYQTAKKKADHAYTVMQLAWEKRRTTRETMNRKASLANRNFSHYDTIWSQFHCINRNNNARIEALRHEAKYSDAIRRISIDEEIKELQGEIREARTEAKRRAPKTIRASYYQAVYFYENARAYHEMLKDDYEYLQEICNQCEADYLKAKAIFDENNSQPSN